MTIKELQELRKTSEVVFGKVTYYPDGSEIKACVEYKILDKNTQNTLFEGTYKFERYTTDEFWDGRDIDVAEEIKELFIRREAISMWLKSC